MKIKLLALSILLILGSKLYGQPYYFRHYQVENGLSNNAVICSLQDRQGFLWFGTKDGLNRFDGYSFKIFRNDPDNPKSIRGNFIYSLHEDPQGTLWVGTERGICKYDAATESFDALKNIAPVEIVDMQSDNNGYLWFISKAILYKYHVKTRILKAYNQPGHFRASSVCTTTGGKIWVATRSGLIEKYNPATDLFTSYDVFAKSPGLLNRWIEKLYDTGKGSLLIGTTNYGAKLFDINTNACKDILTYNSDKTGIFVRDFISASNDEYWMATESGIFIYNIKTGRSVNLKKDYNDPYAISDNAVYTLYKDKEGGIWAGTFFGGINYYTKQYSYFKKYYPGYGINSISGNAVNAICRDNNGNLWIGTEDAGLNKLDPKSGHFTHFSPSEKVHRVAHTNIHGLIINGDEIWASTFHHGLDVLNVKTGKIIRHYAEPSSAYNANFINYLLKTRAGKILAGTQYGLYYFDAEKDQFSLIKQLPGNYFFTAICEDNNGIIWTGTYNNGLQSIDLISHKTRYYKYIPSDKTSLSNNRVNWIFEDSSHTLWIATEDGLCKMDKKAGTFKRYTVKNGFPSNLIFAILEDAKKNLWISTSSGLVCFSPATEKVKVFTKTSGLLTDQFNYASAYKDPNGRMYFGSVKGLISFHPGEFTDTRFLPPIYFTGFQVNNQELDINKTGSPLKNSVTYTDHITLPYNQSSFSINFAALTYTAPEMTEYAYKMQGLSPDWTYLKTNRKAYFTGLPPGTYTFYVKAANNSSIWNGKAAVLTIKILAPIWATYWAYLAYMLILIAVVYYIIRHYHQQTEEKNKHEKEKEIYDAKIEFFTNVAHEIRTPLTLIKGPMELVMEKADEVPAIKKNLRIMEKNTDLLLKLTNQLLDFRKIEIKGFRPDFVKVNISKLLKDNYALFKPAAEQKKLRYKIDVSANYYAYADVDALNKMVSNLLDNAIKYAKKTVYISLLPYYNAEDKTFTIEVKNDGYLIPAEWKEKIFETFFRLKETEEQSGTGIGLSLSRSLAELHKGTLKLRDVENDMNIFVLTLPVYQQDINNSNSL